MALAMASVLAEAWDCAPDGELDRADRGGYSCDIARPLARCVPRPVLGASGSGGTGGVQKLVYGGEDGASGLFRVEVAGEDEIGHIQGIEGMAGGDDDGWHAVECGEVAG